MDVNSAAVAHTQEYLGMHIYFRYTINGVAWRLSGSSIQVGKGVELSVSHSTGRFHAAYWRDNDIRYTWADVGNPYSWSTAVTVNEGNTASGVHVRPAVAVNPTKPLAQEGG
jgi:hypothetical protein